MPLITTYDGKLLFRCDGCRSPRAHLAPCEGCIANLQRTTASDDVHYTGPWLCRGCVTRHRNGHAREAQGLPQPRADS